MDLPNTIIDMRALGEWELNADKNSPTYLLARGTASKMHDDEPLTMQSAMHF